LTEISSENVEELVANVFAPGLEEKASESFMRAAPHLIGVARISSLSRKGGVLPVGKVTDISAASEELWQVRSDTLLIEMTNPELSGAAGLFAGDWITADWGTSYSVNDQDLLQVNRQALGKKEFEIASTKYREFRAQGNTEEFNRFVRADKNLLDEYAKGMAATFLKEQSGGLNYDETVAVFKFIQWMFEKQLRERISAIRHKGRNVVFSLDLTADNISAALDAAQHWFAFGFNGINITIKDPRVIDAEFGDLLDGLVKAGRMANPDGPMVFMELPAGTPAEIRAMAVAKGIKVIRNSGELAAGAKAAEHEAIDIDSSLPVADLNGSLDAVAFENDSINAFKRVMNSNPSCEYFRSRIGRLLYGDPNDRRDNTTYRIPLEGDALRILGRNFARRLKESLGIPRRSYEAAYQRGLEYVNRYFSASTDRADAWNSLDHAWGVLNGRVMSITVNYGTIQRTITGKGLHGLLLIGETIKADMMNERPLAEEYYSDALFYDLVTRALRDAGFTEEQRAVFKSYISGLQKFAAAGTKDDKIACNRQLFGFLKGVTEAMAFEKYRNAGGKIPAGESDIRALRTILRTADAAGMTTEGLKELLDNRSEYIRTIEHSAGSLNVSGGIYKERTLFETVLYCNELRNQKAKSALEVETEIRMLLNGLLNAIENGSIPESLLGTLRENGPGKSRESLAIAGLLEMLDLIEDRKPQITPATLEKEAIPTAIESIEALMRAA
jgi:hypothetical protein